MTPAQIDAFFSTLHAANPHPVTELEYTSVFELLAAVLLSAQATDVGVNKATRRLFPVANTPQKIIDLGLDKLMASIQTIGLYRTKAANLMKTCQILVNEHGGEVPRTGEALEQLPGVGRKTANVVLGTAYGIASGVVVDTHVQRISQRLDLTTETDPVKIERDLMKIIPQDQWIPFSHRIILHGRALCVARKPKCAECKLSPVCYADDKIA